MSRFKNKSSNIKPQKTIFSLAEKHNEKLQEFDKKQQQLPILQQQISRIESDILVETNLKNRILLKHKRDNLQKELSDIENNMQIKKYFLKNSSELLKYFSDSHESKATVFEEYMKANKQKNYNGKIFMNTVSSECKICKQEKTLNPALSIMVCNLCGSIDEVIINCDKPNFKDVPNDKSQYTYDRRHHFKELINQIQGKESTEIPQEVIKQIKKEIKKYKIPVNSVNKTIMRKILKKNNLVKYYEHIANILTTINPDAVIRFTEDQEKKLFYMFDCIQEPFIRFCPEERKNLINYNYIFYKFCQILKLDNSYKDYFTLLKSRPKLAQHEKIWKQIIQKIQENPVYQADDIDWKFWPSI